MEKRDLKFYVLLTMPVLTGIGFILLIFPFAAKLSHIKFLPFFCGLLLLLLSFGMLRLFKYAERLSLQNQRLSSLLNASRQEIKSTLFLQLCYKADLQNTQLSEAIAFFHLEERLQNTAVAMIRFPSSSHLNNSFHKEEGRELQQDVLTVLQSVSDTFFPSFWFWENPDTVIGIIEIAENLSENMALLGIQNLGRQLQETCRDFSGKPPVLAFGSITQSMEDIARSYNEASELLNHKIHHHLQTPYSYDEFQRTEIQFDYNKQQLLARYIRLGKSSDAISFLNSYYTVIHSNPHTSVSYVRETTAQILELVTSTVKDMPIIYADCAPKLKEAVQQLDSLTHVHDFGQFLLPLIEDICNTILSVSANKGKLKIDKLINWIQENYSQDLSLDSLAAYIGCSPAYTSRLFKKETNYDIITYLSSVRIKHAKELLSTTKMTVEEIAASVGFNHQQTFIRNFKKLTGLTPTEYRNSSTENNSI